MPLKCVQQILLRLLQSFLPASTLGNWMACIHLSDCSWWKLCSMHLRGQHTATSMIVRTNVNFRKRVHRAHRDCDYCFKLRQKDSWTFLICRASYVIVYRRGARCGCPRLWAEGVHANQAVLVMNTDSKFLGTFLFVLIFLPRLVRWLLRTLAARYIARKLNLGQWGIWGYLPHRLAHARTCLMEQVSVHHYSVSNELERLTCELQQRKQPVFRGIVFHWSCMPPMHNRWGPARPHTKFPWFSFLLARFIQYLMDKRPYIVLALMPRHIHEPKTAFSSPIVWILDRLN